MLTHKLVGYFSQDDAMCRKSYVPRQGWWEHYEFFKLLDVPNPPLLACFGSAVIDSSPFAGTVSTVALVESAAMMVLISLHTAREGMTRPTWSSVSTYSAHAFHSVGRIICMSKHLVYTVRDELSMEKIVRDTLYTVKELTVILDATEKHLWRASHIWEV